MNPVTLEVLQASQIIAVLSPIALDLALKLKAIFSSVGSDITTNIKNQAGEEVQLDQDAIDTVNTWLKQNALQVAPVTLPTKA